MKIEDLNFDEFVEALENYGKAILSLKKANPNASDEKILQTARTIVQTMAITRGIK